MTDAQRIAKLTAALRAIKDCSQEDVVDYIQEVDAIACDALDVDEDAATRDRAKVAEEEGAPDTLWVDLTSLDDHDMMVGAVKAPKEGGYLNCDLPYVPKAMVSKARIEAFRHAMNIYREVAGDEGMAEAATATKIAEAEKEMADGISEPADSPSEQQLHLARIEGMRKARERATGHARAIGDTITDFNIATRKVPESIEGELSAARKIESAISDMISEEEERS